LGHCSISPALFYKYDDYPHLPLLKSIIIPCINIILCPLLSAKSAFSLVAAKRPCRPLDQRAAPSSPLDGKSSKASFGITVVWVWVPFAGGAGYVMGDVAVCSTIRSGKIVIYFTGDDFFAINITRARRMRADDACISSDLLRNFGWQSMFQLKPN
jgi:hypothetical protein